MKNTFGNAVTLTLFGESHGEMIGAVLDGLAPGIPVAEDSIRHALALRRPAGKESTSRVEADEFSVVSGVKDGFTTGTPLCLLIPNRAQRSSDYEGDFLPRPGHADYTAEMKYHGFQDKRGGGHFSGRITAPLVAAGAILKDALEQKGVFIGTHARHIAGVYDREFEDYEKDIKLLSSKAFPVLDEKAEEAMRREILCAKESGDSVGGELATCILGLPAGLGEPWFDSVESVLSHALFSIPGIKGVSFGAGFDITKMRGSEANDPFYFEGDTLRTRTNQSGGINGGITNGMPVLFRTAVRPTPTLSRPQETVDYNKKQGAVLSSGGRHDPCIVHRARIVVDSLAALVLADLMTQRFGTDFLRGKK